MKYAQIIISAVYHDANDIDTMLEYWYNDYSEFSSHMVETEYQQNDEDFMIKFEGLICDNDYEEFMILSHHAEGLYEDTGLEYFSVEPKIITHLSPRALEILKIGKDMSYPALFDSSGEYIQVTFPDLKDMYLHNITTNGEVLEDANENAEYELAKYLFECAFESGRFPKASSSDSLKELITDDSTQYIDLVTVNPLEYAIDNFDKEYESSNADYYE